ncbi:hypothetical protein KM043_012764 [Ampulex compressa]|nr:hypothetical protein KM043_012764 [Ampulex compressa]
MFEKKKIGGRGRRTFDGKSEAGAARCFQASPPRPQCRARQLNSHVTLPATVLHSSHTGIESSTLGHAHTSSRDTQHTDAHSVDSARSAPLSRTRKGLENLGQRAAQRAEEKEVVRTVFLPARARRIYVSAPLFRPLRFFALDTRSTSHPPGASSSTFELSGTFDAGIC